MNDNFKLKSTRLIFIFALSSMGFIAAFNDSIIHQHENYLFAACGLLSLAFLREPLYAMVASNTPLERTINAALDLAFLALPMSFILMRFFFGFLPVYASLISFFVISTATYHMIVNEFRIDEARLGLSLVLSSTASAVPIFLFLDLSKDLFPFLVFSVVIISCIVASLKVTAKKAKIVRYISNAFSFGLLLFIFTN